MDHNPYTRGIYLAKYRRIIEERSNHDLIMNILPVFAAILIPVVFGVFIVMGINLEVPWMIRYQYLGESVLFSVPILIECVIIGTIIYTMYARLKEHAERDKEWRLALIDYAETYTEGVGRLKQIHEEGNRISRFPGILVARLIMVLMVVSVFALMFFLIPWDFEITELIVYVLIMGVALVFAMFLTVFIKVLRYPYLHEQNQIAFAEEFSSVMAYEGVTVGVMRPAVKHRHFAVHIVLLFCTLGLYSIVLLLDVFRSVNDHIYNQWDFEDVLLERLTNTKAPVERAPLSNPGRKSGRLTRNGRDRGMPKVLIIAELFMLAMIAVYLAKLVAVGADIARVPEMYDFVNFSEVMASDYRDSLLMAYFMVAWNTVFIIFAIDALMTIASRKAKAWRKVVQSCVTFIIPTWLSYLTFTTSSCIHIFDLDPFLTTAVLYLVMLIMFVSPKVKEFYTPSTMSVPGMRSWLKFAVYGELEED